VHRIVRLTLRAVAVAAVVALAPASASAHYERPTHPPDGSGHVPAYRTSGPHLVVCKQDDAGFAARIASFSEQLQSLNRALYAECLQDGFRDLQAAVDHVDHSGSTIFVLPGLYREEPSLLPESDACNHLDAPRAPAPAGYQILSFEQQKACPHQQNLVGIFGVNDLQIEGTGASPSDVVFDAQFQRLNVIRGDRTNGLYLRNFTAERSTFNAVYVIETDGFVVNQVVGRWNVEYGFLSFASDHGLIANCEAYGNGDSGIYPGGTSDINRSRAFDVPRYAIEVTRCHSHDNNIGYSGTGGDSVWAHDNEFDHNQAGASMDSLFPNHPGLPQNHALFEHNLIHSNNSNFYGAVRDGTCRLPFLQRGIERGTVCPNPGVPVGAGVLVIGGNYDVFRDNWVYDNWRVGFVQTWVPGWIRNDFQWPAQEETSNFDHYQGNHMGTSPDGMSLPNGLDFFWDGQGVGSCWQADHPAGADPLTLPACSSWAPVKRLLDDPNKLVVFGDCGSYDIGTQSLPLGCNWFTSPPRPGSVGVMLDIQLVGPVIQLVAVVPLFLMLLRRRPGRGGIDLIAFAAAVIGSVVLLFAAAEQLWYVAPPGIAVLGIGWLAARRMMPGRRLAALTLVLGLASLLEAVDSGIVLLPLPAGAVWLRLVLEIVWIVWTGLALIAGARAIRVAAVG